MRYLIVPFEKITDLNKINKGFSDRACTAKKTSDGVWLTNADKLGDPYWSNYHDFLSTLVPFLGEPVFKLIEEETQNEQ